MNMGPPWWNWCPCKKRKRQMSLSPCTWHPEKAMWAHNRKVAIYKPGERPSPELDYMDTLSSDFQLPEPCGSKCCLSHPDYSLLWEQPELRQRPCKLVGLFIQTRSIRSLLRGFWTYEIGVSWCLFPSPLLLEHLQTSRVSQSCQHSPAKYA